MEIDAGNTDGSTVLTMRGAMAGSERSPIAERRPTEIDTANRHDQRFISGRILTTAQVAHPSRVRQGQRITGQSSFDLEDSTAHTMPTLGNGRLSMTAALKRKSRGAYYTPDSVVRTLINWAVHDESDRFLDPSCGDGRFIAAHNNSVGIEQDTAATHAAIQRAPWALVHEGDFFSWAAETQERFTAVGGNPPFVRYQTFKGDVRARAIALCNALGARFSGLASSWAPFLVASASVLEPGGRMAFVVPAEIGHAPYAAPVLEYLAANFETVDVIAYRDKLFPELSEDCWLLYAEGFGGWTPDLRFTALTRFEPLPSPPSSFISVNVVDWRRFWNRRLRPFILPSSIRDLYLEVLGKPDTKRLRDLARVGIGYVSGNNDFFHLRPSDADRWNIPQAFLRPTVRRSEYLPTHRLTTKTVDNWRRADE
jgi:adenine-specific DNA-methyltransferase